MIRKKSPRPELHNAFPLPGMIEVDDERFLNPEHYFYTAQFNSPEATPRTRELVTTLSMQTSSMAIKILGELTPCVLDPQFTDTNKLLDRYIGTVQSRSDWNSVTVDLMTRAMQSKFDQFPEFAHILLEEVPDEHTLLISNDAPRCWCVDDNVLGKILTALANLFRHPDQPSPDFARIDPTTLSPTGGTRRLVYNPEGAPWIEEKHGVARHWYPNGTLAIHTPVDLDGFSIDWHPDGNLRSKSWTDAKNRLDGTLQVWYPNGQLKREEEFTAGKRDGVSRKWYRDGTRQCERIFARGKKHGLLRQWTPDSTLDTSTLFDKDMPMQQNVHVRENVDNGPFTSRTWESVRGVPYGRDRTVDHEGRLLSEHYTVAGQKSGADRTWSTTGELTRESFWKNGDQHGTSMLFATDTPDVVRRYRRNRKVPIECSLEMVAIRAKAKQNLIRHPASRGIERRHTLEMQADKIYETDSAVNIIQVASEMSASTPDIPDRFELVKADDLPDPREQIESGKLPRNLAAISKWLETKDPVTFDALVETLKMELTTDTSVRIQCPTGLYRSQALAYHLGKQCKWEFNKPRIVLVSNQQKIPEKTDQMKTLLTSCKKAETDTKTIKPLTAPKKPLTKKPDHTSAPTPKKPVTKKPTPTPKNPVAKKPAPTPDTPSKKPVAKKPAPTPEKPVAKKPAPIPDTPSAPTHQKPAPIPENPFAENRPEKPAPVTEKPVPTPEMKRKLAGSDSSGSVSKKQRVETETNERRRAECLQILAIDGNAGISNFEFHDTYAMATYGNPPTRAIIIYEDKFAFALNDSIN